ncbi:MAG: hypothetical protein WBQ75_14315, partial [Acetobacteraceae bacterium]
CSICGHLSRLRTGFVDTTPFEMVMAETFLPDEPPLAQHQEFRGAHDPDAAPRVQDQKVPVTRHDDAGLGRDREFEVDVVLHVPAVSHDCLRLDPDRRSGEETEDFSSVLVGKVARELRSPQYVIDFSEDGTRQGDDISPPSFLERLAGNAVSFEGGPDNRTRVKDDQERRSAL